MCGGVSPLKYRDSLIVRTRHWHGLVDTSSTCFSRIFFKLKSAICTRSKLIRHAGNDTWVTTLIVFILFYFFGRASDVTRLTLLAKLMSQALLSCQRAVYKSYVYMETNKQTNKTSVSRYVRPGLSQSTQQPNFSCRGERVYCLFKVPLLVCFVLINPPFSNTQRRQC